MYYFRFTPECTSLKLPSTHNLLHNDSFPELLLHPLIHNLLWKCRQILFPFQIMWFCSLRNEKLSQMNGKNVNNFNANIRGFNFLRKWQEPLDWKANLSDTMTKKKKSVTWGISHLAKQFNATQINLSKINSLVTHMVGTVVNNPVSAISPILKFHSTFLNVSFPYKNSTISFTNTVSIMLVFLHCPFAWISFGALYGLNRSQRPSNSGSAKSTTSASTINVLVKYYKSHISTIRLTQT